MDKKPVITAETKAELVNQIWDAMREQCCATGLKAKCIVMIHKSDIEKLVNKLGQ